MTNQTLDQGKTAFVGWEALHRNWGWLLALGIVWVILGSFAIVIPFAATLALELVLGAIFAVGGIAQIVQAFRCRGWRGFALQFGSSWGRVNSAAILMGTDTKTPLISICSDRHRDDEVQASAMSRRQSA